MAQGNVAQLLAYIEAGKLETHVKAACTRLGLQPADLEKRTYEDMASPEASKEVVQLRISHWETRRRQRMREVAQEIASERREKEDKSDQRSVIKPERLSRRVSLAHTSEVRQRAYQSQVESLNRTISKLIAKEDRSARVKADLAVLQSEHRAHLSQRNSKAGSILARRKALEEAREKAEIRRQWRRLRGETTPRAEAVALESEPGVNCYTEPVTVEDESRLIMYRLQQRLDASEERCRAQATHRTLSLTAKKQHFQDTHTRFLSLEKARKDRTNRVVADLVQQQTQAKARRQAEIAALRLKAASHNKDLESKLQSRLHSRSSSPKKRRLSEERDWEKREAQKGRYLAEKGVKEEREMLKRKDFEENRRRIQRLEKLHKEEILRKYWRMESPEVSRAKAPASYAKEDLKDSLNRDNWRNQLTNGLTRLVRRYLVHK